ncbi:MAG: TIGR04282 family arsenosugar biosynthesis glycosyltransferase [Burkholderiales bacterium]|nr:TIGR04282 family arsenosugar biosynthesis glycosyltransferase [Phycisphaerae bacterium]
MRRPLALVIVAKYPTPGRVKTRLQPQLSAAQSADVQRAFLLHVAQRLTAIHRHPVIVCHDPPDAAASFTTLLGGAVELLAQSPGTLGDRLAAASMALCADYRSVLFFGVDSPDVPQASIMQVIDAAAAGDVILAPTADGGFWTMGVPTEIDLRPLLADIAWSSGSEFTQTTERLTAAGFAVKIGPAWSDVDRAGDLDALMKRLAGSDSLEDRVLFEKLKDVAGCESNPNDETRMTNQIRSSNDE